MNPVPKSITVDISELSPITETTSLPRGSATGGEEEEVAPFLHEPRSQIHHRRHLGTFADHRDDVFSQLGVPIKTTIPANVLEEALNGTVTVRPLPIGTSVSGKVCIRVYKLHFVVKDDTDYNIKRGSDKFSVHNVFEPNENLEKQYLSTSKEKETYATTSGTINKGISIKNDVSLLELDDDIEAQHSPVTTSSTKRRKIIIDDEDASSGE
ncbi:hypothetical protein L6452_10729 [Arctium lappa]|uniref:Uncharacterized protein n=1 Tax=Arctium lappa TaxID=4217 RepID=A0ACB9DMU2_ARCLA|nr:hypothetical protein L6452_10729 [Arctium lappa]